MSMQRSVIPADARVAFGEPEQQRIPTLRASVLEEFAHEARPASDAVAVLVCHGMGQQVRYETLGQVAKALLKKAAPKKASTTVRVIRQQDELLARAEVKWEGANGDEHEVHLYEAYWAPLTEGKVTYRETLKFLFVDAGWTGLKHSRLFKECKFERWMFGRPKALKIGARTKIGLLAVMTFLLLQVGIIAVVSVKLAAQVKSIDPAHFALAQILEIILPGFQHLRSTGFHALAVIAVLLHAFWWWFLVFEVFFVRYFLIQYVGDVAAYISPYKDSKFEEVRHEIQKVGLNAAKAIYGFTPNAEELVPKYRRVIIVGHSLGSVVAYDTLNAAINLDNVSDTGDRRQVVERTRALITFGSPLDKTAFLFRNQPNHLEDPLREQMVAGSQPLILDYASFRSKNFRWVNIWSPRDVISGSLDYYDDPDTADFPEQRIENLCDKQAWKPLIAHVQYWDNELLARVLHEQVTRL